jgi:hypothetical protein
MRKITVNGATEVRTLSPFAYKDPIKSLEKSTEARVTLDGVKVFQSAVTSGRDVKNAARALKYHLYFYATAADAKLGTSNREFMAITAAEFAEYKGNPSSVLALTTVVEGAAAPVEAPAPSSEDVSAEPVEAPAPKRGKRAKIEA